MPGLGDALSKAMNDSQRGLDDLVRRAAQGESESAETDITQLPAPLQPNAGAAARPPDGAGRFEPVSQEEKEFLVVPLDGAREVPPSPPPSAGREPAGLPKTERLARLETPARPPAPPARPAPPPPPARPAGPMASSVEPIAPFAPSGVIRRQLRRPTQAKAGDGGGARELLVSSADRRPLAEELVGCLRLPGLPGSEAYRSLALVRGVGGVVQAILSGKAGTPAMVALCGAAPGAGCTTVAVAVALELAVQARLRVLLVDADFRSPGLDALAGGADGPGFAEVLAGGSALEPAMVCSESESLAILPLGRAAASTGDPAGVARLFEGPALGRVLDGCRGLFDTVIFDVGYAGWRGAAMLAGAAGTAVLVVRSGKTGARAARHLRRGLGHFGAQVIGAVLNCAPAGSEK